MKKPFPTYIQLDAMDCGSTCLRMIAKYYGRLYSLETLRQHSFITREGGIHVGNKRCRGIYWVSLFGGNDFV